MNVRHILLAAITMWGLPLAALVPAAIGQDTSLAGGTAAAPAADDQGRVKVQLFLVRTDWSEGKDIEGLEEVLEALLDGVTLPDSFRADPIKSASRILFPDQFLAVYEPPELASSLAWMAEHDLIRVEGETEPLPDEEASAGDASTGGPDLPRWTPLRGCSMFVDESVLSLQLAPPRDDTPPFVRRSYGWHWQFASRFRFEETNELPLVEVEAVRTGQRRDVLQVNDQETVEVVPVWGSSRVSFDFAADKIAAIHGFHDLSHDKLEQSRASGWDPILIVAPATLEVQKLEPSQLAKPASLAKVSVRRGGSRFATKRSTQRTASNRPTSTQQFSAISRQQLSSTLDEERQVKVFSLANARALETVDLLKQLMKQCAFAADERTNSLIASGPADELAVAEALLLRLDQAPAQPQYGTSTQEVESAARSGNAGGDESQRHNLERLVRETRNKYEVKEEEAKNVAQSVARQDDPETADQMRQGLKSIVNDIFVLRQQLQRAELELLGERMRSIESQLQKREILRDEIVARRVEAMVKNPTPQSEQVRPTAATPTAEKQAPAVSFRPLGSAGSTTLRSPTEFRDAALEANRSLERFTRIANQTNFQENSEFARKELEDTQQRLALLRDEYAAQIRLLELEVASGEVAAKVAERTIEDRKRLYQKGFISSTELDEASLAFERAKLSVEQARTLLDLYRKAGETTVLSQTDSDLEPDSESKD